MVISLGFSNRKFKSKIVSTLIWRFTEAPKPSSWLALCVSGMHLRSYRIFVPVENFAPGRPCSRREENRREQLELVRTTKPYSLSLKCWIRKNVYRHLFSLKFPFQRYMVCLISTRKLFDLLVLWSHWWFHLNALENVFFGRYWDAKKPYLVLHFIELYWLDYYCVCGFYF